MQQASPPFISAVRLQIVMRKLPRAELRRYVRETPFNRAEVTKLWLRFSKMDMDSSGTVTLQASLAAGSCCRSGPSAASEKLCCVPCIRVPSCAEVFAWQCMAAMHSGLQQGRSASLTELLLLGIWPALGDFCAPVPALPSSLSYKIVGGTSTHGAAHSQ